MYLITIANDEDLENVLVKQAELNESLGSFSHLHLFMLSMQSSLALETTTEVMLGVLIKINVVKNGGKASNEGRLKMARSPPYITCKEKTTQN